jgi:hypothetical protein
MRSPASTSRLVPELDLAVHIVLYDFGTAGRVYREIDEERTRLPPKEGEHLAGPFARNFARLTLPRLRFCSIVVCYDSTGGRGSVPCQRQRKYYELQCSSSL